MKKSNCDRSEPDRERVGELVTIYRRAKTYWCSYQLDRRQRRESLRTSNRKEARRKAGIIDVELQHGTRQASRPATSIEDAVQEYLSYLETEGRAAKTLVKYRCVLNRVQQLATTRKLTRTDQIDLRFIDSYRKTRTDDGRAEKTIYTESLIVRQFINFAVSRGLVQSDPLQGLKIKKPQRRQQPCWSPDQVEQILTAAVEPRKSVYLCLADTGMRFGEVQWLTWRDIDFDRNLIHIRAKPGWRPKTGKARTVPMTSRLRLMLKGRKRSHQWVFTASPSSRYPGSDRQISERRLLKSLKRLLKTVGLPTEGKLHTFRHSFISKALACGIPSSTVRSWVGHVSDEILNQYTHVFDEDSQSAIQRFTETQPETD